MLRSTARDTSTRTPDDSAATPGAARPVTARDVIRSATRHRRPEFARLLPFGTIGDLADVLVPTLVGLTIDLAIRTQDVPVLLLLVGAIAVVQRVGFHCWSYAFLHFSRIRFVEIHRKRVQIVRAVLDPRARPTSRSAGEILSIATSDADRMGMTAQIVQYFVPSFLALAGASAIMAWIDWTLGIAVALAILLTLVLSRFLSPVLVRRHSAQQEAAAEASAVATDLVSGLRVLQGLGVQRTATARYRAVSRHALGAATRNARLSGSGFGTTMAIGAVLTGAVAVLSGAYALDDRITPGQFVIVMGLARMLIELLGGVGEFLLFRARVRGSAERIAALLTDLGADADVLVRRDPGDEDVARVALDAPVDTPLDLGVGVAGSGTPATPVADRAPGPLAVRGARHRTLRGVDLDAAPGAITGIVCSPVDASALLEVLGSRTPGGAADGSVLLGETALTRETALAARAVVLQEPHRIDLFEGTLRDQVATRRGAQPDAEIEDAIGAAGASDLLDLLPGRLDAPIQDRGTNLSGGQRQRIALARALAANTPVLVLDDPTSAVDSVTELQVASGLRRLRSRGARTTLVLTRSPALLEQCDRVIALRDGRIVAEGTHPELLETDPVYAEEVLR